MSSPASLILIADDDPGARLLQTIALQSHGFVVEAVADGVQALAAYSRIKPDCLVLDVMMPGLLGFDVCREIRKLPGGQHVPILILTSLDDLESISTAYSAGASDFAHKALNPMLLVERVRFLLRAKRLQDDLLQSEARLAQAQRLAQIGHWEFDPAGQTRDVSPMALEILELLPTAATSFAALRDRVHRDDIGLLDGAMGAAASGSGRFGLELRFITPTGLERTVRVEGSSGAASENESSSGTVLTLQNITDLRCAEEQVRLLAYFDSTTGLPNARWLRERLLKSVAAAAESNMQLAVISLDVGQLSRVTHTFGTAVGDEVLRSLTERLQAYSIDAVSRHAGRQHEFSVAMVARMASDRFSIVLPLYREYDWIADSLRKLTAILQAPFLVAGHDLVADMSMGVTIYPDDATDPDKLLEHADTALHHAQLMEKGSYHFYSASLQQRALRRVSVESELRNAIKRDQMELHFQPRIDLATFMPTAAEALLRWRHPERGFISPAEFIPMAEETGIIHQLWEWVLNEACARAASLARRAPIRISVNVSAAQFRDASVAQQVMSALWCHSLDPSLLELEITEGVLIERPQLVHKTLDTVRQNGVMIALDDFGTGYSSLSYLRKLPLDYLKIDRSFIADLQDGQDGRAVAAAILALARSLKLRTVAEGVETLAQLRFVADRNCDECQGFLFAKAMSGPTLVEWLRNPHATTQQREELRMLIDSTSNEVLESTPVAVAPAERRRS